MTLNLGFCSSSSYLSRFSLSPPLLSKLSLKPNYTTTATLLSLLFSFHKTAPFFSTSRTPSLKPLASSLSQSAEDDDNNNSFLSLNEDSFSRVSAAKDANEALQIIAEITNKSNGLVNVTDCCGIITAAIDRGNTDLALSVFYAMRSSFDQDITEIERWKWSRPDVSVYTSLVQGLAAALKVSDALKMIDYICRVGVSPSEEEVSFGKVVRCPTCMIAVAVAQPQHGIQIASCAKCRYQYELVSGDITSIDSEAISMDLPAWERGLRFLQLMKRSIPAAVHSIVVQTPSGSARTHRFATETVDLPAQKNERVTIASAVPSNVYRNVGPFKFSPNAPNVYPGEPMCLTNHENGRESLLLRAPVKDGKLSLLNPSVLVPLLAVLVAGDAASGIIDPSLPQFLAVAAISSLGVGATLNTLVFPRLNQLPQKSVDATAIKQKLLSQYDLLQSRIKELKEAAEKEICSKDLEEMTVRCPYVACIGLDVGSDVSAGEQDFCCRRTFLSVNRLDILAV
ncbi:PREDICTED: uncharacterized protein LOC105127326 isoform X2 [Populus euphratica]|uniref:Uncharacterized protein LOC105127326 isoform X2 n=1 Tax=Populus euphratica TaxID=75702 RepID=A0AAJ6UBX2_POPEU|nr:PREDICTED: uncharacterized protein LOC105127326 isoform X2 [Populus euphratica]